MNNLQILIRRREIALLEEGRKRKEKAGPTEREEEPDHPERIASP
jgi:hypothetical protein